MGGSSPLEGFLETSLHGKWGAVCTQQTMWTDAEAKVVCRQLGFPDSGATAYAGYVFDDQQALLGSFGRLPFVLSMVQCNGTETQLSACSYFKGVPTALTCSEGDAGEAMHSPVCTG